MAWAAELLSAKAAAREGREADACGGEKDMAGWMDGFVRIEKMEMMLWWALEFPHEAKSTGLAERNQFSSGGTRWPSPLGPHSTVLPTILSEKIIIITYGLRHTGGRGTAAGAAVTVVS